MLDTLKQDAEARMQRTMKALDAAFAKIRTGRAHPSLLDGVTVDYYGTETPLGQVASVQVEDGRSLVVSPWEKAMIPAVEKAILKSDLGLTPSAGADSVRLPMPPLTEENRRELTKIARAEAEQARVAIRNIRRDINHGLKEQQKQKEITEDELHRGEDQVQKLVDAKIAQIDAALHAKEADLMEI